MSEVVAARGTFTSHARDLSAPRDFEWIAPGLAFGGDYSPEQWPRQVWREDAELMQRAGVNVVSLGVFSWGLIEVADGEFDFGWLDEVMDLLHAHGVSVDLATPSAAPPMWLHEAHPEIRPVDAAGVRWSSGGRLGWYPSSQTFRRYALRMVENLARHVADHPGLVMWHVSNELGNENHHSYDDETAAAFRQWLAKKYGRIAELNQAWGTAFWGHRYRDFAQVLPPRVNGTSPNPGLELDFDRFTSDALLDHFRAERDVLRKITPNVPVTTNFMIQREPGVVDYARWAGDMDLVANDHYTAVDPEREYELSWSAARTRGVAGGRPWLLMEHSTSAVSWQPRNRAKDRGEMVRNSLAHIAHGSEGAMFFQWRQSAAGAEQFHSAMVPHAGPDTALFAEVCRLGGTIAKLAELRGSLVEPARVAVLFSFDSATALRDGPKPSVDLDSITVAKSFFAELVKAGIAVDVLGPDADLSGYDVVIVPTLYLVSDDDAAAIAEVAKRGGDVVVTAFSGIVTPDNRVRTGGYPGAFSELLGVRMEEFRPLQPSEHLILDTGWCVHGWSEYGQATTAQVLARYSGGELDGAPAITENSMGEGHAMYVSCWLDRAGVAALVERVTSRQQIAPVAPGSRGLERVRRISAEGQGWLFALNHEPQPAWVEAHGRELITGRDVEGIDTIEPGGVAIYRELR